MSRFWRHLFHKPSSFSRSIHALTAFYPRNEVHYELALRHGSMANRFIDSNQRLELLGDAVLGSIVADFLYSHFPEADEGFLSSMRSKIVNRKQLNAIAQKMGIDDILHFNRDRMRSPKSIYGDALEALIGAVYLDRGYADAKKFVFEKIIQKYVQLDKLSQDVISYKALLFEWSQRMRMELEFTASEGKTTSGNHFQVILSVNQKEVSRALGASKKAAEEEAAKIAARKLGVKSVLKNI